MVMLEDARRDPDARDFAQACATLIGLATRDAGSIIDAPGHRPPGWRRKTASSG